MSDNLFSADNIKLGELNYSNTHNSQLYLNGLHKAQELVNDLEKSLQKSSDYEERLLKCKGSHSHSHSIHEWWDSDAKKHSSFQETENTPPTRNQVELTQSWSTMSIVCLQYQYEELTKRYESLLQAYDGQIKALNARDASLERLRRKVQATQAQLNQAHKTLLTVGEKYLALKRREKDKENKYDQSIENLRASLRGVLAAATRARLDLDAHVERSMVFEKDAAVSQLLSETRRCNRLYLENLRLKAQIDELVPGSAKWGSN